MAINKLKAILDKENIEVPPHYFDYLISDEFNSEVPIYEDESAFILFNLNELCEKINVDGNDYLTIRQMEGYIKTLKEVFEETITDEEKIILTERSHCITIGYENTRILYVDSKDNNTVWIFHVDGGDSEKTAMTLDKIINRKN
jgi:hypothetical protein